MKNHSEAQRTMRAGLLILSALLLLAACTTPAATAPEATEAPAAEATEAPKGEHILDKLQVVSRPDKVDYLAGETFDPTGIVINAIYQDGTVEENVPFECPTTVITGKMSAVTVTCMGRELMFSLNVVREGNLPQYSVEQTPEVENSPVKGQTFFWIGSSVTFGVDSEQESMADFFCKKYGAVMIKEAVSGTTLATYKQNSYVERLDKYIEDNPDTHVDAFICQLSTNDTYFVGSKLGQKMPDFITDAEYFDVGTTCGAIEYIIARASKTWDCPIYFYTNPSVYDKPEYKLMVDALYDIAEKWDITIIDMYRDEAFNDITEAQLTLYMTDTIHATKAGYREWWLPKFEEALLP
jgi:hypothetical protein